MSTVRLAAHRITLRPPVLEDLELLVALLDDYDVAKMLSRVPHPYDQDAGRAWIEGAQHRWRDLQNADELAFAIDHDGGMAGCVSFRALHETPVIGYWLGQRHWGKGLMGEAVQAALGWLFSATDHDTVVSEAMAENPGSLRILEKAGFRKVAEVSCPSAARGADLPAIRLELTRSEFIKKQTT